MKIDEIIEFMQQLKTDYLLVAEEIELLKDENEKLKIEITKLKQYVFKQNN